MPGPSRMPSKQGVQWYVDMDKINDLIGAFFATDDIGTGSKYMQMNIEAAFNYANKEFERRITTTAKATTKYAHMFEWGTVGINDAPTNMVQRAESKGAKLWKPYALSTRDGVSVGFNYLPSKAIVPKPTANKTGIPASITSKLSDHVFWNKAKVMETGQTVTVKRIKAKALFIPLAYKGQQGFMMRLGPTNPTPGKSTYYRSHAGTFTTYWNKFWNSDGGTIMDKQVETMVSDDLDKVVAKIKARPAGRWSVPKDFSGQIQRSKKTTLRYLLTEAERREAQSGI